MRAVLGITVTSVFASQRVQCFDLEPVSVGVASLSIVKSFEKLWPNAFTSSVPVVPQAVHLNVLEPASTQVGCFVTVPLSNLCAIFSITTSFVTLHLEQVAVLTPSLVQVGGTLIVPALKLWPVGFIFSVFVSLHVAQVYVLTPAVSQFGWVVTTPSL